MMETVRIELAGRELSIETGRVARQADGAVIVRYGETMILVACVAADKDVENQDFFPLTVDYREKSYAVGRIPGGFFKREGKPKDAEVLSARLIDRPIRPLFAEGFRRETQIYCTVLSSDQENPAGILGIIGASAALSVSSIPFLGPIAAVRIGMIDGEFVLNPTFSQQEESALDLVVAGSKDALVMVEGGAREVSEKDLAGALAFAQGPISDLVALQEELVARVGKPKMSVVAVGPAPELKDRVLALASVGMREAIAIRDKAARRASLDTVRESVQTALETEFPESERLIAQILGELEYDMVRRMIVEDHVRLDGRGSDDIRPITCEIGILPRVHGSALFTRGQTQALATVTLGTKVDEQKIEDLEGESYKSYMLHYNFPPYSVGEARPSRGPGRREIGHGMLAERAIEPTIPSEDVFPYTVRIVSDILESNGSSSMATVCAGSLALLDAGVPARAGTAGIAMGLIKEGGRSVILTDILGDEDHLGDMDLKVAGTRDGITACQMDIKITGIGVEEIAEALDKARTARLKILEIMNATISEPRPKMSPYAPRITILKVRVSKIGEIIGPGGKNIRQITEETGAKIDIEDDGRVIIAAVDEECSNKAREWIERIVQEAEVGKTYTGKVKRITNFGAYVEYLPGKEGLVHISQLEHYRVGKVEDVVQEGEEITVQCIGIDEMGRVDLSRKALLPRPADAPEDSPRPERRGPRPGGDRGRRPGGDRGPRRR
ncbi:polyribonucleotide nucleotidyltransferase [Candidatus Fermentibacteria bacterium]|nr:polyribonucleotide nucleotidyltransferase [Candidatus Fermentibacteria bacterium]